MHLISVESSNVECIGYEDGVIEVHFNNGYVYQYTGTTSSLFDEFLNSESKGRFVHQRLTDNFPIIRIE